MSAPIKSSDEAKDRLTKLLPADITAAFLSCSAAIGAVLKNDAAAAPFIFWTFIAMLVISPLYFYCVSGIKSLFHIAFLMTTFLVFAVSIARIQFASYLGQSADISVVALNVVAVVLPLFWAYLGTQIFLAILGQKLES